ncbi:GNAT family N-acetyltransferase [Pantoea stewartii]|nr:GNAT family N-acetyltransferase [Pantoea stewartii]
MDEQLRSVTLRDEAGAPAGCVALLFQENDSAEIKRVYIRPEYRGRTLRERIVSAIETMNLEKAPCLLRLEMRTNQQPAIALYRKYGYKICGAFPRMLQIH